MRLFYGNHGNPEPIFVGMGQGLGEPGGAEGLCQLLRGVDLHGEGLLQGGIPLRRIGGEERLVADEMCIRDRV